jgi:hypothetical protein
MEIVFLGMITVWYFLALASLIEKRLYVTKAGKRIHYVALAVLLFWCVFALIFGKFAERLYAIITICGMTAVELLVLRRRRLQRQHNEPGKVDTTV